MSGMPGGVVTGASPGEVAVSAGYRIARKVRRVPGATSPPPDDEEPPGIELFQKSGHSIPMMFALFILTIVTALGVMHLYPKAFEDSNNPANPLIYIVMVLAFTLVILFLAKKGLNWVIRGFILGAVWLTLLYVFYPLFYRLVPYAWFSDDVFGWVVIDIPGTMAFLLAVVFVYWLSTNPEWYVINIVGFMMGVGVIAIFGNSFGILPAMILLVALAVYDAIAVYKTKHMIDLADAVTEEHLPVVMVAPKRAGYSYVKEPGIKRRLEEGGERDAMFMGLGDIVIPGVMVASAFAWVSPRLVVGIPANLLVAIGTLLGGLVGMVVLMRYVLKGNPQAGLPLLNGGVLAGYAITYLLVLQDPSLGIVAPTF